MKFDYYLLNTYVPELDGPPAELYTKFLGQAEAAEACGFDTAWFTEHHFRHFGGMVSSTTTLMAAVAQHTRRIRLGSAVVILPLHHPIAIAEQVAMLDQLSGGRVDVGIGRGMGAFEYKAFGSDFAAAQEHMEEQIAVLRAAWTNRPFTFKGRFYDFPDPMDVLPPPLQQPHPPIWLSAVFSEEHYRSIGRQGFNLMTIAWVQPNLARSKALIDCYREGLREGGHDPAKREIMIMFPMYCGETAGQVKEEAGPHWANWHRLALEETKGLPEIVRKGMERLNYDVMVGETRGLFGDPSALQAKLRYVRDELGVTRVAGVFHFGGMAQERALASMRLFSKEVAPALR